MASDTPSVESKLVPQLVRRIDDRLLSLVNRPGLWGPPEAVELQVLQLLELRLLAHDPTLPSGREKWIQRSWIRQVEEEYPQALPGLLATWLVAQGRLQELHDALGRLCVDVLHRMSTDAPVRFPRTDLPVEAGHHYS